MERTAEEFLHQLPNRRWFIGDFEVSDTGIHFMDEKGRTLTVDEVMSGRAYVRTWTRKADAKRAAQIWLEKQLDTPACDESFYELTKIRNIQFTTKIAIAGDPPKVDIMAISRMLDSIAEVATETRAIVDSFSPAKGARMLRDVRRALGYTRP